VTIGQPDRLYIETARPVFEDMRQIVNQLAGLLLLSEAVSGHGFVVRDLLARSQQLLEDARTGFATLKPGTRSEHHYRHLRNAIDGIAGAMKSAQETANGLTLVKAGYRTLAGAWQEMIHASNALPGFERVDLLQSCCAQHFVKPVQHVFTCQGTIL